MTKTIQNARKPLATLLAGITLVDPIWDRQMTGLQIDSRLIKPGDLFLACRGAQNDGRDYIEQAIAKGAIAVVAEGDENNVQQQNDIPIFFTEQLNSKVATIAARFYDHPSRQMTVIGTTGTNGKTTCTHLIAHCLKDLTKPCGEIGTLGIGMPEALRLGKNTTPDAIQLQQHLANFLAKNIKHVAMEVTSHGLDQDRVKHVEFYVAIFTNLTRDHLDYHGDMAHYAQAKLQFFQTFGLKHAIINLDDPFSQTILQNLDPNVHCLRYSMQDRNAEIYVKDVKLLTTGIHAQVVTPWGEAELTSSLLGRFNLANLLAVIGCLGVLGIPLAEIMTSIAKQIAVPGRMQIFKTDHTPGVVIDYAHTPDALAKALHALREHNAVKLWCVFGCGGDRDSGKRAEMGAIAEQYADQIILTNDNPRSEDPQQIIEHIIAGMSDPSVARVETDRSTAIRSAIEQANEDDIVLIAGKGHEPVQIIGDQMIDYSDIEFVKELLLNRC